MRIYKKQELRSLLVTTKKSLHPVVEDQFFVSRGILVTTMYTLPKPVLLLKEGVPLNAFYTLCSNGKPLAHLFPFLVGCLPLPLVLLAPTLWDWGGCRRGDREGRQGQILGQLVYLHVWAGGKVGVRYVRTCVRQQSVSTHHDSDISMSSVSQNSLSQ